MKPHFSPSRAWFSLQAKIRAGKHCFGPQGEKTMPIHTILSRFAALRTPFGAQWHKTITQVRPALNILAQESQQLPPFVQACPVARRYLELLAPLAWDRFPERSLTCTWLHPQPMSWATFVAACLIRLDMQFTYMSGLCQYLREHPALMWLLGFPLVPARQAPWGFDAQASLPSRRHLNRCLRRLPNETLQFLLDETVRLLQLELAEVAPAFGQAISLDTKHIIAWTKENNPKAYVKERYNKHKRPKGDPDARLGVKRRRNQSTAKEAPPTPSENPVPASTVAVKEFYWGYGSGVVAIKVPDWGEFVLAELTQPFNQADVSYFHPLMGDTVRRLGCRPTYGAFDAAFDAWYVYAFFHQPDGPGFAAVPFSQRGGHRKTFDPNGNPHCAAGLPMALRYTFTSRSERVAHQKQRYFCPLVFPESTGETCPIQHANWPKGCQTTLAASPGARIRYTLDRHSEAYKAVYKQRTATERINSQAKALGIERPRLRNQQAIANQNTMIYILINLRALHRIRAKKNATR